jgi:hypothetical protein
VLFYAHYILFYCFAQKKNSRLHHDVRSPKEDAEYYVKADIDKPNLEKRKVSDEIGKCQFCYILKCMYNKTLFLSNALI